MLVSVCVLLLVPCCSEGEVRLNYRAITLLERSFHSTLYKAASLLLSSSRDLPVSRLTRSSSLSRGLPLLLCPWRFCISAPLHVTCPSHLNSCHSLKCFAVKFLSCDSSSFFLVMININNGDITVVIGTSVCSFVHPKCRPIQLPSPAKSGIPIFAEKPIVMVTVMQMS